MMSTGAGSNRVPAYAQDAMARSVAARLSATLFACVALGALGGTVMPAEDGALRLASLEPSEPATTASLGTAAVTPPEPPPQPPVDIAVLKTAIEFYRRGDVAGGDASARANTHPASRALRECQANRRRATATVDSTPCSRRPKREALPRAPAAHWYHRPFPLHRKQAPCASSIFSLPLP
jgi:hypothetical protein